MWLHSITREPWQLQYFTSVFLEISNVTLWSVFPNPVTFNTLMTLCDMYIQDCLPNGNKPPSGEEQVNILPCHKCVALLGELQLRNLILQTKKAEYKWFELGIALGVSVEKLERIYDKHNDSPVKALIRVYRY